MSDPATNAAQYRRQAESKRELAAKVTDAMQKKQLLEEAQALDDLAQTLEVGAPG